MQQVDLIPPFIAWSHWASTPAAWQDFTAGDDGDPDPAHWWATQ